jgi:hypothetical protein
METLAPGRICQTHKTYLSAILAGEPQLGSEPKPEAAMYYEIVAVRWLDLLDESSWGEKILADPFTYLYRKKIQEALGLPLS